MVAASKHSTIVEVANLAGVSPVTASRAFTGRAPVAPSTYKLIMEAARKLQYHPNTLVRGLRGGRTNSIGLILNAGTEEINNQRMYEITNYIRGKKYTPYILSTLSKVSEIRNILSEFLSRRVDGVILWTGYPKLEYDPEIAQLLERFNAVAIVGSEKVEYSCDQVIRDRSSSVAKIAEHFAVTGRKYPVFIGKIPLNQSKLDTFCTELSRHGIKTSSQNVVSPEFTVANPGGVPFVNALRKKFSGKVPYDSIFCTSDEGAAAIMAYLKAEGVKIPEDVAVVGYNNYEMCCYLEPPLSSVEFHFDETARTVLEMLWQRFDKPDLPVRIKRLLTDFIWRKSAGGKKSKA